MNKTLLEAIIEWDVVNWSKALDFWKHYLPQPSPDIKILTLGERNGGLSLWLASLGYNVIYSDRLPPTEKALQLHQAHHIQDRITYFEVDVYNIPFPDETFDVVLCKSTIGGLKLVYKDRKSRTLENQHIACEEIRRVLKTGGVFLGAENMRGSFAHKKLREKQGKDIGWRYMSCSDLGKLFSNFSKLSFKTYGFIGTNTRFSLVNNITGSIDNMLSRILPPDFLYISFISAKK